MLQRSGYVDIFMRYRIRISRPLLEELNLEQWLLSKEKPTIQDALRNVDGMWWYK